MFRFFKPKDPKMAQWRPISRISRRDKVLMGFLTLSLGKLAHSNLTCGNSIGQNDVSIYCSGISPGETIYTTYTQCGGRNPFSSTGCTKVPLRLEGVSYTFVLGCDSAVRSATSVFTTVPDSASTYSC